MQWLIQQPAKTYRTNRELDELLSGTHSIQIINYEAKSIRFQDWATRLDAYIRTNADRPFSYGVMDCCQFVFGAIEVMTGNAIGERWDGLYRTKRESLQQMQIYAGRPSLYAFASKLMQESGFAICPPLMAGRGDVVLVPQNRDPFLGVLDLNGRDVLSVGEHGTRRVPINIKCRAWRI